MNALYVRVLFFFRHARKVHHQDGAGQDRPAKRQCGHGHRDGLGRGAQADEAGVEIGFQEQPTLGEIPFERGVDAIGEAAQQGRSVRFRGGKAPSPRGAICLGPLGAWRNKFGKKAPKPAAKPAWVGGNLPMWSGFSGD